MSEHRHGWLDLLTRSGPFLTVPVADRVWPAGVPAVAADVRAALRRAVADLMADRSPAARDALAEVVFQRALGWGEALVSGTDVPAALAEPTAAGTVLRPDFAFHHELASEFEDDLPDADDPDQDAEDDDQDTDEPATVPPEAAPTTTPWRLLGMWLPWGTHPLARSASGGSAASGVERMAQLLRARDVPLGLVSDGRWWALVWAPRGQTTGTAIWDADLWSEDADALRGFVALLERRRFLGVSDGTTGVPDDRLPALLAESGRAQEEVTTTLGAQVREAVGVLVERLDELDDRSGRVLLAGVSDDDVYAGVVTVMMRIVFLLFAEERALLPADDYRYATAYSVGQLVEQLEVRAQEFGEQTLEHRTGGWLRLMAVSRALHRGVAHADLRLPAYGGGLFDPERFSWLEGRDGLPPGVDDLTVLRMLQAVQYVQLRGERRRLTFRALDVEQIGYVYEGLLELEVRTADQPVLGLRPQGKNGLTLLTLEEAQAAVRGLDSWTATTYLGEKKLTPARRTKATRLLAAVVPPSLMVGLSQALSPDTAEALKPLAALIRTDERGLPVFTAAGGRFLAPSSRRAATGAHYTPRSLAEEVVRHALEPLVQRPGPLETLDESLWVLRPSSDLLALRVADIAMGSGAFLVAACRYLADRLVDAWHVEGDAEAERELTSRTLGTADAEVSPVVLRARRAVAEHCLYGVDVNPLAVEMAKLSLWLVTMDRERPFGFLDDRIVAGDSLLGLTSLDQLETLHLDPVAGRRMRRGQFDLTAGWRATLAAAADTRRRITALPVRSIRDYERKADLLAQATAAAAALSTVADALTGAGLQAAQLSAARRDPVFTRLEQGVWRYETGDDADLTAGAAAVQDGQPAGKDPRTPLHWPLVFPEVFADTHEPGFDAIVGNPPFLGGKKISGTLGTDYLAALQVWDGHGVKGSCDLGVRFLLRADRLLSEVGQIGYVETKSVVEGEPLRVGLLQLAEQGRTVRRGCSAHPWPSASASLSIVELWLSRPAVASLAVLDGEAVPHLGPDLQPFLREIGQPLRLHENDEVAFQGSVVLGLGFTLTDDERDELIARDPASADVIFRYVIGADLNRRPDLSASRWVVNFDERTAEQAQRYPGAWEHVRAHVYPERQTKSATKYPRMVNEWWKFWQNRVGLTDAIQALDHVLAISLVGNTLLPVRVPTGQVFAHACAVFALQDFASLALLSSSVHQVWAIRYTSTLETRIRYAPSDVFLTLPRPAPTPELPPHGEALDSERREIMLRRALGLTKLYNQVHDPRVTDPQISRLRELHAAIDLAVRDAYGWTDLDLGIGHHQTKLGTRWTVSPEARFEILDRLLVENHRRATAQ